MRIRGELLKLGVRVSATTIATVLLKGALIAIIGLTSWSFRLCWA